MIKIIEKTIKSQVIFEGRVIKVRLDDVMLGNGRQARREVVEHPGAVAILAVTDDGDAFFVRQYRKALEKELLEIPAGKLEPGEDPADCAARELAEETGMMPGTLSLLASYYSSPGFASEKLHVYQATGLKPVQVEKPEDEVLEAIRIPVAKALEMARQGEIEDGKTLIALLLAKF